MHALSTSGLLSAAQTASRGAANCCSPDIVIAIENPPGSAVRHELSPRNASEKSRFGITPPETPSGIGVDGREG
jgi:hypothetical protein